VPKHAQALIGAKTLQRSLRTGCEKTAHRGRHSVIAEFHGQIASAGKPEPRWEAADLEAYARRLAAGISAGTVDREQAEIDFDATFEGFLSRRAKRLPKDAEGDPILPPAASVHALCSHVCPYLSFCPDADGLRNAAAR
jgi:hypothetical protein